MRHCCQSVFSTVSTIKISTSDLYAGVVEWADTRDLKNLSALMETLDVESP